MEGHLDGSITKQKTNEVRLWMTTQPHLPKVSETEIHQFLHCNYGDVELAKKTIENYYTFRTKCKDFFTNRDIEDPNIRTALSLMMFSVLPKSTPEGYRVAYCRMLNTDATNYVHLHAVRMLIMCLDLWMKEEVFAPGHVIIVDMEGMHLGHMSKINFSVLKNYSYYTQEAIPFRLKQIHFLNVVSFMDKLMFIMKPLLRKQVVELINLHTSVDTLLEFIPRECLPEEYGGQAGTFEELKDTYHQKLSERRDEFLKEEKLNLVDESKRPQRQKRSFLGLFSY